MIESMDHQGSILFVNDIDILSFRYPMAFSFMDLKGVPHIYRLCAKRIITFTLILVMLLLSGCMQKVKVTYVPRQVVPEQIEKLSLSESSRKIVFNNREETLSVQNQELNDYFKNWRGVRYRYGGYSTKGVDCSGLTKRAYKEFYGVDLPRTVVEQSKKGEKIDKNSLRPGDLIFFKTGRYSRHVGIYLGENSFIHASRSKGVMQSNLNNSYWRKKYWQAKRYPLTKS